MSELGIIVEALYSNDALVNYIELLELDLFT